MHDNTMERRRNGIRPRSRKNEIQRRRKGEVRTKQLLTGFPKLAKTILCGSNVSLRPFRPGRASDIAYDYLSAHGPPLISRDSPTGRCRGCAKVRDIYARPTVKLRGPPVSSYELD